MRLVQVIYLVEDLARARRDWEADGFRVEEGGRHPGRGTANLIMPLGEQYIELLGVVDRREAAQSPDGRPVLAALDGRGPGPARWSVEPPDIDAAGRRLGLPVEDRRRIRPDGLEVRWRAVGVNEAWAAPDVCAFMTWRDRTLFPGRAPNPQPNGVTSVAVTVGTEDVARLDRWLGGEVPDGVTVTAGTAGISDVAMAVTPPG